MQNTFANRNSDLKNLGSATNFSNTLFSLALLLGKNYISYLSIFYDLLLRICFLGATPGNVQDLFQVHCSKNTFGHIQGTI